MDQYTIDLLHAAKQGNVDAFEHIYRMYKDKIYALTLATLKNQQDAEDATQQTFIQVYEKLNTLRDMNTFNTWIQRIALNESKMLLRKRKGDVSMDDEETGALAERIEDDFMLPQDYAERADLSQRLREIINELPATQRQALVLQMYSNLSMAEIAQVMDCSENTVKSRIRYAKAYIKTEIEERERKSGEKFYGVMLLPFSTPFIRVIQSQSMTPFTAARIWNGINYHIVAAAQAAAAAGAGSSAAGTAAGAAAAKTGMALGAKIAIGALIGAAVIGGAVFGVTRLLKPDKPAATPDEAVVTQTAEGETDAAAQGSTVAPTEAPTEPDYGEAYASYLEVMTSYQSQIEDYEKEPNRYIDHGITVRPVAFADVYGDPTPEMIFINQVRESNGTLQIVSIEDGRASIVYTDELFATRVSNGPGYFLFTEGNTLYASSANAGQYSQSYSYYRFDSESSGKMKKTEVLYGRYASDEDPTPSGARVNGAGASLQEYEKARDTLLAKADKCLMAYTEDVLHDKAAKEQLAKVDNVAMTCAEAIAFLKSAASDPAQTAEAGYSDEDLSAITGHYSSPNMGYGRGGSEITREGKFIFSFPPINGSPEQITEYKITSVVKESEYKYRVAYGNEDGASKLTVYMPGIPMDDITGVNLEGWLITPEDRARTTLHKRIIVFDSGMLHVEYE